MKRKLFLGILAATVLLGSVAPALAADAAVVRVVVVQTDDLDAYMKELDRGRAILKRLGSPGVLRVWRARFAGENAGAVVVANEYPTLTALAADDAKASADPEFQAWLKGLSKVRKIVSDSIYSEVK